MDGIIRIVCIVCYAKVLFCKIQTLFTKLNCCIIFLQLHIVTINKQQLYQSYYTKYFSKTTTKKETIGTH